MTPEMWNTVLSIGLLSVIGAVGWLAKTVIYNASEIKKINALLNVSDLLEEIDTVHSRVSKLTENVAALKGELKAIERQTTMINQHLMDKR